jgi:hypothetical protein
MFSGVLLILPNSGLLSCNRAVSDTILHHQTTTNYERKIEIEQKKGCFLCDHVPDPASPLVDVGWSLHAGSRK